MNKTIYLRAESKGMEARSALTPATVRELVANGFELIVERSQQRAISDDEFLGTGCTLVDEGSWPDAPQHAFILGLKELPDDNSALQHRHIFFAHAYKNQQGWQNQLRRFTRGGGELFDLEYLLNDSGRRVAAFGFWAGFTGCAVGLKAWAGQQLQHEPVLDRLIPYRDKDELVDDLCKIVGEARAVAGYMPSIIILGAKGRVGSGANELAEALGLKTTRWDLEETAAGGPFSEILEHDIFINCVLVQKKIPAFVSMESLQLSGRQLSMITDVSCDPGEYNPIPIYSKTTSFSEPLLRIISGAKPLDLCSIDHFPSLLPVESSEDFAGQLLSHLLSLDDKDNRVWQGALELFYEKSKNL